MSPISFDATVNVATVISVLSASIALGGFAQKVLQKLDRIGDLAASVEHLERRVAKIEETADLFEHAA